MNENSDLLPNLLHDEFELQMRGYSRRQVDDFVTRRNSEIRELEQRLARALDETEHMRRELSTLRQQALSGRPAHQEVSERIAQILKLADDEARAQKNKADEDITSLRAEAQQEAERVRADAREQAERMLTAAQEQAERAISAARAEADKTRTAARAEADRLTGDTRKKADAALANAKSQAKKVLDEATARATAIHDGAERRLNLLSTRHTETVRRLTDILDGVQGLVAAEAARMSLEEEVAQSVSKAMSLAEAAEASELGTNGNSDADLDLARLAPPAPETVATGAAAPPRNGGDPLRGTPLAPPGPGTRMPLGQSGQLGQQGRPMPASRRGTDPLDLAGPVGMGLPPGSGRVQQSHPGPVLPPTPMPGGTGRPGGSLPGGSLPGGSLPGSALPTGSPLEGAARPPMSMPTRSPRPGQVPGVSPSAPGPGEGLPTDRATDRASDHASDHDGNRDTGRHGRPDPDEPPTDTIHITP